MKRLVISLLIIGLCIGECNCCFSKNVCSNGEHKEWFRKVSISILAPGSYAKAKLNEPIPSAILENDAIIGILLDASWKSLEPEEGVYNWDELDKRIEEAVAYGKKISLNVMAGGINTPQWLYNYDIQTYTFIGCGTKIETTGCYSCFWLL